MSIPMNRTAVILLASGQSKRFGWRDKLLTKLDGRPLIDYAAGIAAGVDALVRVAVCPSDHSQIVDRMGKRFVIALNKEQKRGMGHSIALGVQVAMKFKPDAVAICMGDMPFIEPDTLYALVDRLGNGINIVHSGDAEGFRPPSAFDSTCFDALGRLDGDDGARQLMRSHQFGIAGLGTPTPMLADVDTKDDLAIASEQMAIRAKHYD